MFNRESIWIKNSLTKDIREKIDTVLDIGSSNLHYRTKVQPHIDENVFAPLRTEKKKIYHLDIKPGEGVDIVGDVNHLEEIDGKFNLVICTSLLEHVTDPQRVANNLKSLVQKEGYLLVTVPHRYFYHLDPIDTMYRPDNKQLERLFSDFKVIRSEIIKIDKIYLMTRLRYLRNMVLKLSFLSREGINRYLPYLFKKFEMAGVLLRNNVRHL